MIWSLLFAAAIIQGCFLILVFAKQSNGNRLASRLLRVMLILFVLSNADDLLLSSGWYKSAPRLFGYSLGAMFAYGPLCYLYILAIADPGFRWRRTASLHFLPALLYLLLNLPWLLLQPAIKVRILDDFLAGKLSMGVYQVSVSALQIVHFSLYLALAYHAVRRVQRAAAGANFQVPLHSRVQWLNLLLAMFGLFLLTLAGLFAWNLAAGHFVAGANYVFTLITSAILYFIAWKLIFSPEMVTPGFSKKYEAVRFNAGEETTLSSELERLMTEEKIFADPELKLSAVASRMNIPAYRLSTLINDRYGVSFSDFVNQFRVREFIARLNDPRFVHLTLYGLALEVGFNSKSAFNTAFKKVTDKSPSEFKRTVQNS